MRQISFRMLLSITLVVLTVQSMYGLYITGSDLLDKGIQDAIVEELAAAKIQTEVSFDGSLLGVGDIRAGTVDACIVAIPDGSDPISSGQVFSFGFQIVAFAVNADNPVTELDYQQLSNLFKYNGNIETWTTLTTQLDWQGRKVLLWAARSEKAIALEIFNAVVLKGSELKSSLRYNPINSEELFRIVERDTSALMVVPNITLGPKVRLLAVKAERTSQSYTPSADNVFYGDYPLRLPFQLVIADSVDAETVNILLKAIYSDRVTKALEAAYYMPLPASERQAVLSQLK